VGGGAEAEAGEVVLLSSDAQHATAGLSTAFGCRVTSLEMTELCWGFDSAAGSRRRPSSHSVCHVCFWELLDGPPVAYG